MTAWDFVIVCIGLALLIGLPFMLAAIGFGLADWLDRH